jgi:probable F420-dependent oxidoreductase
MDMEIGVVFPQTEFGTDRVALRDYAQAVAGMGYTHVMAYEHVLGANPDRPGGWRGPYTYQSPFYSPFLLFSYMAAITDALGFVTGILILPQRQTALAAKQAATLDVLCGGRFRLGVGVGWNEVEYTALGFDFHTRGRRVEEQVDLLRRLWTEPLVTFEGSWETIPDAGINPMPVQRPIPVWFGGQSDAALRRTARMGDGWLPNTRTAESARPAVERLHEYLDEAGRPPDALGLGPRLYYGGGGLDALLAEAAAWRELGATQMSINTMKSGLTTPDAHVAALRRFAEAAGLGG